MKQILKDASLIFDVYASLSQVQTRVKLSTDEKTKIKQCKKIIGKMYSERVLVKP